MANEPAFPPDHARMTPEALAFYRQAGLGVVAFTAQGRGFFSKAAAQGVDGLSPLMRDEFLNPTNERRLPVVIRIALERGVSVGAVVLAYITSQPMASVAVIGPRSTGQLVESMEGADLELTTEELDELAV